MSHEPNYTKAPYINKLNIEVQVISFIMEIDNKDSGKVISVFAQKGGVGKTTVLNNLAHGTIKMSHELKEEIKIIIIDFDPQVNCTLFNLKGCHVDENEYWDGITRLNDEIRHSKQLSLKSTWLSTFYTKSKFDEWVWKPMRRKDRKELYILGGVPSALSGKYEMAISSELFNKNRGANINILLNMVNKLKENYKYIFLDLNPTMSGINQVLLKVSDHIISPLIPERFSITSIRLLKDNFYDQLDDNDFINDKVPNLLGFVVNRLKPYDSGRGRKYAKEHVKFLEELEEAIEACAFEDQDPGVIGKIEQFDSLATALQNDSITCYEFNKSDVEKRDNWKDKVKESITEFNKIVQLFY